MDPLYGRAGALQAAVVLDVQHGKLAGLELLFGTSAV